MNQAQDKNDKKIKLGDKKKKRAGRPGRQRSRLVDGTGCGLEVSSLACMPIMVEQGWDIMVILREGNIGPSTCCSCLSLYETATRCTERRINPDLSLTLMACRHWVSERLRFWDKEAWTPCPSQACHFRHPDRQVKLSDNNQSRHCPVGVLPEARDVTFHCQPSRGGTFITSARRHVGPSKSGCPAASWPPPS